jgi:nucleoside-diphosphate-sugar epimerase
MFTILGGSGYIGSKLIEEATKNNIPFQVLDRDYIISNEPLGDIIYCIGLTADFRTRPFDTIEAHVSRLNEFLHLANFKSLTYLSSTRVYINNKFGIEDNKICVNPMDPSDLYNLSKLTGESICLSSGKSVRIIRLSNVVGDEENSDNFLTQIIKEIKNTNALNLYSSLDSEKDYIHIRDVVKLIFKISKYGENEIYNVASGTNISVRKIIEILKTHFSFELKLNHEALPLIFPKINNEKIRSKFNYEPQEIEQILSNILKSK